VTQSASESSDRGPQKPADQKPSCPPPQSEEPADWTARTPGWLLLLAGWVLPQVLLLGPALVGRTVNLPVDLLVTPHLYLPNTPKYQTVVPNHGNSLLDLLLVYPAAREFSTRELRAGRLPLWQPANYAGAPFAGWPKYSLFELPYEIAPGPVALAWISLLQTLTCGLGMWLFLRRGLCLSYWPAAVASWCAPLTGFMTLWQGHILVAPVCWLPWMLLAVRRSVEHPWGWSTVCLAILTALLILSGAPDVVGLVLITTGLYAIWLLATDEPSRRKLGRATSTAIGITLAWLAGFLLAAPYLIPLQEYMRTGARLESRTAGSEERPPVGLSALPTVVVPDFYGSDRADSIPLAKGNRLEGSAGACAGLLAVFWLAPLAGFHRGLRRESIFFALLAVAGLGWTLGVPVFVNVLRMKPFNILSYNRWVFATADAILVLAAIGMESLRRTPLKRQLSVAIPMLLAAGFGFWCLIRLLQLPEPLFSQIETSVRQGRGGSMTLDRLRAAQHSFSVCYAVGALLSLAAEIGWLLTLKRSRSLDWCQAAIVVLLPAQLLWFAWGERRQADWDLYFPRVAALEKLAALPPGRIWGIDCLPPNLNQFCGLEDIRGYDAVDPSSFVKLFDLARDPRSPRSTYAATQEALPQLITTGGRVKLHPVADFLNVRYLVLRTPPPVNFPVVVQQDDYWVLENRDVLPRAFVPRSVKVVKNDAEALAIMQNATFDPRETVLTPSDPDVSSVAQGTVDIQHPSPTHAILEANLASTGIVVVSEMWDPGWRAELDGVKCPLLRVDTALQGVRVPSGKHRIQLIYDPPSLRLGIKMAMVAAFVLLLWSAMLVIHRVRAPRG
jgi:hypothetical protein